MATVKVPNYLIPDAIQSIQALDEHDPKFRFDDKVIYALFRTGVKLREHWAGVEKVQSEQQRQAREDLEEFADRKKDEPMSAGEREVRSAIEKRAADLMEEEVEVSVHLFKLSLMNLSKNKVPISILIGLNFCFVDDLNHESEDAESSSED